MKTPKEYIPLQQLIPSLGNLPRIYFLYWQSAQSGTRGSRLRFQLFRRSLPEEQLKKLEVLFQQNRP